MTWEELNEKQRLELEAHNAAANEGLAKLWLDKIEILEPFGFMEGRLPERIKQILETDYQEWQAEWGIHGRRAHALNKKHETERRNFLFPSNSFQRQASGRHHENDKDRER